MKVLLITNLYPPQELGGYGRCMADYAWGLLQKGHYVEVISSDAKYLGNSGHGPNGEKVHRILTLKGSFERGVEIWSDKEKCKLADENNRKVCNWLINKESWDSILIGNIDLISIDILSLLLKKGLPTVHHIGFVAPPYPPHYYPREGNYKLVCASNAVKKSLISEGLPVSDSEVIYPAIREDLFGIKGTNRELPEPLNNRKLDEELGTRRLPIRIGFAGLLMGSKGVHNVVEAMCILKNKGIEVTGYLAGDSFQVGYKEALENILINNGLNHTVKFVGRLTRSQLARFYVLHHIVVFPSIYPEAFGIVAAEAMASGITLVSSGVGGASEAFVDGFSGLKFKPGDSEDLSNVICNIMKEPQKLIDISCQGQKYCLENFSSSVYTSKLEKLLAKE